VFHAPPFDSQRGLHNVLSIYFPHTFRLHIAIIHAFHALTLLRHRLPLVAGPRPKSKIGLVIQHHLEKPPTQTETAQGFWNRQTLAAHE